MTESGQDGTQGLSQNKAPEQGTGFPVKAILSVIVGLYILFFWSFMFIDGQFAILHKRKPSLNNIILTVESKDSPFAGFFLLLTVHRDYKGVVFGIGKNGVDVFKFWE